MAYKPMEEKDYLNYLKIVGWQLIKGGIDYNLFDDKGVFVCTIKINHGKGKKREVIAFCIHKTEKKFKERGLKWPPKKK
jgi:hypothetical protein